MKGIIRILRRFVAATIIISFMLLVLNFILLGTLVFKEINQRPSPEVVVREAAEHLSLQNGRYTLSDQAAASLRDNRAWAMLLGNDGQVHWEYELPDEIPRTYTLADTALFARYYLMDYPVFTWQHPGGLLVVGYPKNSYGKYQLSFLSDWVSSLPVRILVLLLLNIAIAILVSLVIGTRLIKRIRPLAAGIHHLAADQPVQLDTRGLFGDVAQSINTASSVLQSKTEALKARDEARSNWIAGISHDIRTPLSMVLGYASEMEDNPELPLQQRQQAGIIRRQGEKLRSLVSDLNLVSMLEYEMQPLQMKPVRPAVLVRQVVADFLNNGLDERYEIDLIVSDEVVHISCDEKLLLRAIGNLVQNSVNHNPQGCRIELEASLSNDRSTYEVVVRDNGRGIPEDLAAEVTELPYSSRRKPPVRQGHGLGLPMAARIAKAHHGRLVLQNTTDSGGLTAIMAFPFNRPT